MIVSGANGDDVEYVNTPTPPRPEPRGTRIVGLAQDMVFRDDIDIVPVLARIFGEDYEMEGIKPVKKNNDHFKGEEDLFEI